jgi:branched-chain amino acid transport system substrate-binding protein
VKFAPAVLVAPLVWLSGCRAASGSAHGAADSAYIGVAITSNMMKVTDTYFNGVALAVAHLNAVRPKGARPLGVRRPPDQVGDVAVAAAFRDDPSVIGVVGHTGSAQTLDAAPIYADLEHDGAHALVAVTPTATNPLVTRTTRWVFRVCPTDNDAARALARFAVDSMGAGGHRLAVVYRNDVFGKGYQRAFGDELARMGRASTIVERDPYLAGLTAYDAYGTRIAARKVDILVVAGTATDVEDVVRAVRSARSQVRVLGSDDVGALEDDTATVREFRGTRYTSFFNVAGEAPETRAFVEEYRRMFGKTPDQRAALSYDAALVIGEAEFAVGADRRRIRNWLSSVGRGVPAVTGATGSIRFSDSTGDAIEKPVSIGIIQ